MCEAIQARKAILSRKASSPSLSKQSLNVARIEVIKESIQKNCAAVAKILLGSKDAQEKRVQIQAVLTECKEAVFEIAAMLTEESRVAGVITTMNDMVERKQEEWISKLKEVVKEAVRETEQTVKQQKRQIANRHMRQQQGRKNYNYSYQMAQWWKYWKQRVFVLCRRMMRMRDSHRH